MGDVLPFHRATVHVEDLLEAVNAYYRDVRRAVTSQQVDAAKATFREFCEVHRLPLDFPTAT